MVSTAQEEYILKKAYVPEHIIRLMVGISGGEPFLAEDHVFFVKDQWLIFVGYPLDRDFQERAFASTLEKVREKIKPAYTWFIAPKVPPLILPGASHIETDEYYKLDIRNHELPKNLLRQVEKAEKVLAIEKSHQISQAHLHLIDEFLQRENPPPMAKALFLSMQKYVDYSPTSLVLSAWDKQKNLSAFYVMELGALAFATYVVGCFSKTAYVAHASDLLFFEMIKLARENQKEYMHLGLGVNEGIRKFKKKWGGKPFLKYEFCEIADEPQGPLSWIKALGARL